MEFVVAFAISSGKIPLKQEIYIEIEKSEDNADFSSAKG